MELRTDEIDVTLLPSDAAKGVAMQSVRGKLHAIRIVDGLHAEAMEHMDTNRRPLKNPMREHSTECTPSLAPQLLRHVLSTTLRSAAPAPGALRPQVRAQLTTPLLWAQTS